MQTLLVLCAVSEAGVVAHWKFDETAGSTAQDSVGTYPGTLVNGASFASDAGVSGGALQLNRATQDVVDMGDVLGFTSGDFSIQAWLKLAPGDTNFQFAVAKHASGFRNGYILHANGIGPAYADKAGFYVTGPIAISVAPVNDGNWHQVVGVYRAGVENRVYVDGTFQSSVPAVAVAGNASPFLIGGIGRGSPSEHYSGLIDDVQVYDHALSDLEVAFLFQNPGQPVSNSTTLTPGDINEDRLVDRLDVALFAQSFGTSSGATWTTGDFDNSLTTTVHDLAMLQSNLGEMNGFSPIGYSNAVPEPAMSVVAALALAAFGMIRYRQPKQ